MLSRVRAAAARRWCLRRGCRLSGVRLLGGQLRLGDEAVVVEPEQLDHVVDVGLARDRARAQARFAGEYWVVDDPPLLAQSGADVLGKGEVRGVVAVQVSDLAVADPESELATSSRCRGHAGP